jgi:tRNA acetyltransferase TAN1
VESVLSDFNLLATTMRGSERQMCYELAYLLKEIGDSAPEVNKTGIRGVIVGKTALNPVEAIEKFRSILKERPYEFRYALRIIPIEKVVNTDLNEIKRVAAELAAKIGENETFRVTVEKRFTSIHSRDFIEAAATDVQRKADMENPDKILLIEVIGRLTGVSLIKPSDVLAVVKEKML